MNRSLRLYVDTAAATWYVVDPGEGSVRRYWQVDRPAGAYLRPTWTSARARTLPPTAAINGMSIPDDLQRLLEHRYPSKGAHHAR